LEDIVEVGPITGYKNATLDLTGCKPFVDIDRKYRVIENDCRGFNNLSYTIHLR